MSGRIGKIDVRRRQQWLMVAISVVILGASIYAIGILGESDFTQDYAAARGWWAGLDPNGPTLELLARCCPGVHVNTGIPQTAHPPLATLLVLPFALMPYELARALWLGLGWVAIVWTWWRRRVGPVACLASGAYWVVALSLGALEPVLFALLAWAFIFYERAPARAGVLIGLAAALKVYPAVLLVGLALQSRRATLAAVGAAIGGMALAELVLGHHATAAWLAYTPVNTLAQVDTAWSVSLVRVLRALLPGASPLLLALPLGVLLLAPMLPLLRRGRSLTLLLAPMLLISPICWVQYLGLLDLGTVGRLERAILGVCGVLVLLVWLHLVPGDNLAPIAYGPLTLAMLLIWYRQARVVLVPLARHSDVDLGRSTL